MLMMGSRWAQPVARGAFLQASEDPMNSFRNHHLVHSLAKAGHVWLMTLLFGVAAAQAQPIMVISDASVVEGNSGTKVLSLQVSFAGAQPNTVTGTVSAIPLSGAFFNPATGAVVCGAAGVDFEQFSAVPFSIPPNTANGTLTIGIRICGDTVTELNEHIFVFLSNVVGAQCLEGTCDAVASIVNDDVAPTLSINNISTSEPVIGTKTTGFTVSLNHTSQLPISVNFATRNGTAKAACQLCSPPVISGDYFSHSGTLQIAPNTTSASISVSINSGISNEPDENFFVDLSAPVNASIAVGSGRGTIRDTTLRTGGFDLSPDDLQVSRGEKFIYTLDWTVPPNEVWRNLASIDLRLRGAHDTALWVRWDEASNLFHLCSKTSAASAAAAGDVDLPQQSATCGPGALPGSGDVLATPYALLHMADTSVKGSGPQGQSVTLTLGITLIGKTAGHDYKVELAAADDFGNEDRFERAGDLSVRKPDRH
jgi:hypothetical protein